MVKVATVRTLLPHSSVAVKVTVALPVAPHSSLKPLKSLVQVIAPHKSSATAPPLLDNQEFNASVLPKPSHSTVISSAASTKTGAVVSTIVKVAVVLLLLPHSSLAVKVTVALPVAPHSSLKPLKSWLQVIALHRSLATAPPLVNNQLVRAVVLPKPSHSTIISCAATSSTGAVVSTMVKVACVLLLLPHSSLAVKVTVALPVEPHSLLKPLKLLVQGTQPHITLSTAPSVLFNQPNKSEVLPIPSHSTVKSCANTSIT